MIIPTAEQIRYLDNYTIQNQPISSIDLMEKAASQFVNYLLDNHQLISTYHTFLGEGQIKIICGVGNNGGDGLAIARMLINKGYRVNAYEIDFSPTKSSGYLENKDRLGNKIESLIECTSIDQLELTEDDLVIDAILGTGLSRPTEAFVKEVIKHVNRSNSKVISVDIPSGLFPDDNSQNPIEGIIQADLTLTFQFVKQSFLQSNTGWLAGGWKVLDIGLLEKGIDLLTIQSHYVSEHLIKAFLMPREIFAHKGIFGHALIIAGSLGKIGAAHLAAKACIKSGAGLVTVQGPKCGTQIIQTSIPEVMYLQNSGENYIEPFKLKSNFQAIGIGPGLGQEKSTINALKFLIQEVDVPLTLDADALNILSNNPTWLAFLKPGTILTPHVGEFKKLLGINGKGWNSDEEKLKLLKDFCFKHHLIVVLKGAFTVICSPNGNFYFNSTGNSGMATAGSGDSLLGIITAFVAQGYEPINAAVTGVYLHGLAGDLALEVESEESLMSSDIINQLGNAFNVLHQ